MCVCNHRHTNILYSDQNTLGEYTESKGSLAARTVLFNGTLWEGNYRFSSYSSAGYYIVVAPEYTAIPFPREPYTHTYIYIYIPVYDKAARREE